MRDLCSKQYKKHEKPENCKYKTTVIKRNILPGVEKFCTT
jgi:hypothetical protein